jgi:putative heme-binding domain-containing protein
MSLRAHSLIVILLCLTAAVSGAEFKDKEGKTLPPVADLVKLTGSPDHGKQVFMTLCFICHQINGTGIDFGPNLSEVGSRLTKELIYQSIFEPSAVIAPGFDTVTLKLEDTIALGIVVSENDSEIVLKAMGGAKTTYKKADIVSRTKGTTSLMPVGQQAALTQQDLVDLVEYLFALKKK